MTRREDAIKKVPDRKGYFGIYGGCFVPETLMPAHKINNAVGQVLLAKKMGKKRVIAETGAGQHGVATATGAALKGLECEIYMGTEDIKRQALNVFRMRLLGAKETDVPTGSSTLKD